jgi:hypothetical protein
MKDVIRDTVVRVELTLVAIGLIALTFMWSSPEASRSSAGENPELRERVRLLAER